MAHHPDSAAGPDRICETMTSVETMPSPQFNSSEAMRNRKLSRSSSTILMAEDFSTAANHLSSSNRGAILAASASKNVTNDQPADDMDHDEAESSMAPPKKMPAKMKHKSTSHLLDEISTRNYHVNDEDFSFSSTSSSSGERYF
jgi:hypothetical protein